MRLTLRTLLAYRDRVLNPAELHDMHGRVQQSGMASNLLKRIDALSQRTNILAPPVEGRGLGADPNSIAEYLDDALTGEKVPELERICLESDVQLAELSHCHQLLSTAQSTVVDVSPALRQRLIAWQDSDARARALAERPTGLTIEPETKAALSRVAAKELAQETQSSAAAARHTHRPDGNLHRNDTAHGAALNGASAHADSAHAPSTDSASSNGHVATSMPSHAQATSTQAGLAHHGSTPAASTAGGGNKTLVVAQPVEAPMVASGGHSIKPSGLDLEGSHLAHEVPEYLRGRARDGWRGPLAIGALVALLCLIAWQSMGSWSSVREMFAPRTTAVADASRAAAAPGSGADASRANNAATQPETSNDATQPPSNAAAAGGAPNAANGNAANGNATGANVTSNGQDPAGNRLPNGQNRLPRDLDRPADVTAVPLPESMGPAAAQWLPADGEATQAVLFAQASGQTLHRVQPGESLPSATQLFVPTASRPTIDINRGPRWGVCGLTHLLVILPDGSQELPIIDLRLGRALVVPSATASSIVVNTPDSQVQLSLADATTQVALELMYLPVAHGPVNDRQAYAATLVVTTVAGSANLQLTSSKRSTEVNAAPASPITLAAGQMVIVSRGGATAPAAAELPSWIDPASERPIDRLAMQDLARQLTSDEPIGNGLHKLATGRRPETRALAAQSLALLGAWDWVTQDRTTLNESRDRNYWFSLLDTTRQMIAANPENAGTLQAVLTAQDATAGQLRSQVWLGLAQSQLEGDTLAKMLAMLESEQLLDRILAIYQLQRLTGKDLGYQAGELNRPAAAQWSRELSSGKLQLMPLSKVTK